MKFKFKANMPRSETKTHHDYYWLLPEYTTDIVSDIKDLTSTGFDSVKALTKALDEYFRT